MICTPYFRGDKPETNFIAISLLSLSIMESCDLVYDKKTIMRALQVFCDLGSDGGIKRGQIWLILDEIVIRAKISFPNNIITSEIIGIDSIKMGYIFGKIWKSKSQSDCGSFGDGFYTHEHSSCIYVT